MKHILLSVFASLFFIIAIQAQVGIGTTSPHALLDIRSSNQSAPTNSDGVLIPKADEFPVINPTATQDGMLLYLSGNGTPSKGFYHWNQVTTSWVGLTGVEKINDLIDGKSDADGTDNGSSVFLGLEAGANDDLSDNQNVGMGSYSLFSNTTGYQNVAIGRGTLQNNTTGYLNTAIGFSSMNFQPVNGRYNTAVGAYSLNLLVNSQYNTAVGYRALYSNVGGNNTAVGNDSMLLTTTGGFNTAMGNLSLYSNTSGVRNTAIGSSSLYSNSVGSNNVTVGYNAGYFETGSNRLYIENSDADVNNALIYGEFGADNTASGNILRTNGEFQIGNPTTTGYAFPVADGTSNQVLQTDGAGTIGWIDASTLGNSDHDFYEEGTTTAPDNINDDQFTMGNLAIGKNTADFPLDILTSNGGRGVSVLMNGTSNNTHFGEFIRIEGTGTGTHNGTEIQLSGTGGGAQLGTINVIDNSGNGLHYGSYNVLRGTGTGTHYGNWVRLEDVGSGQQTGNYINITNSGNNTHYGAFIRLEGNGSGTHNGTEIQLAGSGNGAQLGTINVVNNSGNGLHYGSYNVLNGAGTGAHYGNWARLGGVGSGTRYGSYIEVNGSGGGLHYGAYNDISSTGTGTKIGVSNIITNNNDAIQFGISNNLIGNTNATQYGTSNLINTTGDGDHYGVYNSMQNPGNGDHYGTYNSHAGNSSGTGNKYGTYNRIFSSAGGTHYGVYSSATKIGSYAGYFLGRVSVGTIAGNTYILPAARGTNGQIMQTDGLGNVSWVNNLAASHWTRTGGVLNLATATDDIVFTSDQTSITFPATAGTPPAMMYMFDSGISNADRMVFAHSTGFSTYGLQYSDADDSFRFLSAGTSVVEVDLTGTTVLSVVGNVNVNGDIITDTATYPDYVFEKYFKNESEINPDYNFRSLAETKTFILENGHLPGVKSYAEVEENDMQINLSELSVTNLEKIEELFIYAIEAKELIENQQAEIESIKKEVFNYTNETNSKIENQQREIQALKTMVLTLLNKAK